jgi:CBS domain-containing protein
VRGVIRICDLMHRGVVTCSPDDNLEHVARIMKANQFRSVVVAHESGEVWGLISMMDLIRHYGQDLTKIRAEDVMRPYRIDVDPQWPIEKAIGLMKQRKIEHLIIIDPHAGPQRPIGILTSFDIVLHMSAIETGRFEQMLKMHAE